jgi:hypothetical protein
MSEAKGRRRTGTNAPVGGKDIPLAPPQEFVDPMAGGSPVVLASTDPDEAPPPPMPESTEDVLYDRVENKPAEEITELSPEEQVMFASLMTCGRRSKVISVLDHTVVVQTLCCDDDLRIGLYVKDFQGSIGEQRAYQVGVAAAGIRSIDGVPLVQGLYEQAGDDALFDQKVAKVVKMYPTIVNRIYRAVMDAEKEFVELATKLGKLSG